MALKMNGGTTIAGAIILAHMAGTPVFATGGLAGVHRDEHVTINVSAGLTGLARTPVAVVCSGPKLLVSAVGDDIAGKSVLEHLKQTGLDRSRIAVFLDLATGQCVVHHDPNGQLLLANADMKIIEHSVRAACRRGNRKIKTQNYCGL